MQNLTSFIDGFLNSLVAEKTASKNTLESYQRDLEQLPKNLLNKHPVQISETDLKKYINSLSSDFKTNTICRKISSLRQFFHFLASEEIIEISPARTLEFPKKEKLLPKFLTPEEINLILDEAQKENSLKATMVNVLIEILKGSGLRVSEVISLKRNSIQNFNNKPFLLVKGKGSKERITPLTKSTIEAINNYIKILETDERFKKSVYLFPSRAKSGFVTRQQAANLIKEYALKAGIEAEKISPHVLRHSFATNLLQKGMDIRVLQEILGHSDISSTQIYTHTNIQKMSQFIQKNHPLANKTPSN